MSIKNMTKEDLELLSNKDITNLLLEEKGKQTTPDLFKKIIKLLELPESTFDQKIGDYYTSLTTDKIIKVDEDEDEDIEEIEEEVDEEEETDDFDSIDSDDDDIDSGDDDLKDLVVLDEDEIEAE